MITYTGLSETSLINVSDLYAKWNVKPTHSLTLCIWRLQWTSFRSDFTQTKVRWCKQV